MSASYASLMCQGHLQEQKGEQLTCNAPFLAEILSKQCNLPPEMQAKHESDDKFSTTKNSVEAKRQHGQYQKTASPKQMTISAP
eukprot:689537-Rhodomonas_salina.4